MKTRSSLVSNSSTSSFICLLPKKNHDEIVENLIVDVDHPEIYRKILNSTQLITQCKKFGMDMVSFSYTSGNVTIPEAEELISEDVLSEQEIETIQEEEDYQDTIYEMISKYTDEVSELEEKQPDIIFSQDISDS